jgi:hypothetical protein
VDRDRNPACKASTAVLFVLAVALTGCNGMGRERMSELSPEEAEAAPREKRLSEDQVAAVAEILQVNPVLIGTANADDSLDLFVGAGTEVETPIKVPVRDVRLPGLELRPGQEFVILTYENPKKGVKCEVIGGDVVCTKVKN